MPEKINAEVISRTKLADGIYIIRLFVSHIASLAQPGQFINILIGKDRDFILRRPFSIHRVLSANTLDILFKVRGRGTEELAKGNQKKLDVIGPLGKGYSLPEQGKQFLIVAGGIGLASLFFLAERLIENKKHFNFLYGTKNSQDLLYYLELKRMSHRVTVVTEDGSKGKKGRVTDYLLEEIQNIQPEYIYSCGPEKMLKKVAEITTEKGLPCQISMEREMACGLGACLSCVCRTKTGRDGEFVYSRVCYDGPVFEAKDVIF